MNCKTCPYFDTKERIPPAVPQIVGFCKLREKYIDEVSVVKQFCKDRAVITRSAAKPGR